MAGAFIRNYCIIISLIHSSSAIIEEITSWEEFLPYNVSKLLYIYDKITNCGLYYLQICGEWIIINSVQLRSAMGVG